MKKVIITSKNFSGEIILLYGADLMLLSMDFQGVALSAEQIDWIKNRTPVILHQRISDCFSIKAGLEFVLADYEISFEMFWTKYGQKINADRCKGLWKKLSDADKIKAYAGIDAYNRHLASLTWNKNRADPENYLKKKYWNNEWQ